MISFKTVWFGALLGGFVPWGPCCFVSLFAVEMLYFVVVSVEWSDLVGGPRPP